MQYTCVNSSASQNTKYYDNKVSNGLQAHLRGAICFLYGVAFVGDNGKVVLG